MTPAELVTIELTAAITVNDRTVITRVTGPGGDEWRESFYNLHTEADVLQHLAYNFWVNGVDNINRLEGWADVDDDAVTFVAS